MNKDKNKLFKLNYDFIKSFYRLIKEHSFSGKYNDLKDKPESLKNPHKLKFTGAIDDDYDGSEEKIITIPKGSDQYTHPSSVGGGNKPSGLYKIATDANGHISGVTEVTKGDITSLGIPAQDTNTTYGVVTTSANGLMSYTDKTKLNRFGNGFVVIGQKSGTTLGSNATAEGGLTTSSGSASHAEGQETVATGALGSHSEGYRTTASGNSSHAEGDATKATSHHAHAEGAATTASGENSHAEGEGSQATALWSHAEGFYSKATNAASHASGKYNKAMYTGGDRNTRVGDVFVIGNGTADNSLSNALRVTYAGQVLGTQAFGSSGADYAEFIKPWYDDNSDEEDRVGYFVTVRDDRLYKAKPGDYIVGITSGNPSIIGNNDEDYYWRWERDEFNRIVMIDVPELAEKVDENGKVILDEETGMPIMEETGKIIKNGDFKTNPDYNYSLLDEYVERKDRPEWDYVGMIGVIPVRDDGTCKINEWCKCKDGGIATLAEERSFDTFLVIERVNDHVVKVIMK